MTRRILIIEDEVWFADLIKQQIRRAGYQAEVAPNSIRAMEMINREKPDAIVLDISLPGPNGIALLHEINSHSDLSDIQVVVCTSHATPPNTFSAYCVSTVIQKDSMLPGTITKALEKAFA